MIYKYFKFNENAILSLVNNELWASKLREFNDPFESLLTVEFDNREVQDAFDEYVSNKAVCCFSRDKANILMWSHYADSHKGFCIGIDEKIYENNNLLSNISYKELDSSDLKSITTPVCPGEINKNYEKLITHKHEDWKYEKEARVILELNEKNSLGKTLPLLEGQIKEVYFGCKMLEKHKMLIKKIMKSKVDYYQMGTSKKGFYLIDIPLTNEKI